MLTTHTLGIYGVRYSGQYIEIVRVVDDGKWSNPPLEFSRQAVVDAVHNGVTIETLNKGVGETWDRWGGIKLITVDGSEFIKLADDGRPLDDLGDLPEY